eukprot:1356545-Amphidinium_carterae.1
MALRFRALQGVSEDEAGGIGACVMGHHPKLLSIALPTTFDHSHTRTVTVRSGRINCLIVKFTQICTTTYAFSCFSF